MGFWNEVKKVGKKLPGAAVSGVTGFLTGGPAGAAVGIGSALLGGGDGGSAGGGGAGATGLPELDNLRRTLANEASALPGQVVSQIETTNDALRNTVQAQEQAILQEAERVGAVNTNQANEIRRISEQTGQSLSTVMDQLLGEKGITAVFQRLEQESPQIIVQADAENERLVQAANELQQASAQVAQQFPEFVAQNQDIANRLGNIQSQSQQFIDSVTALTPAATENIETLGGIQSTLGGLGGQAQDLFTGAGSLEESLVAATEEDLAVQEAREQEELLNLLGTQGIADSGAARQSLRALQESQARRRNTTVNQVRSQAKAQQFGQQAQALQLGTGIAGQQTATAGAQTGAVTGAANVAGTGAGIAQGAEATEAQRLGIESQVVGQGADLLQAQNAVLQSGLAFIDSQGNLIDRQTGRALQGQDLVLRAAQARGTAATGAGNVALSSGNVATQGASQVGALERDTAVRSTSAPGEAARVSPGIEQQVLSNISGGATGLGQLGLTGTGQAISASQTASQLADEAAREENQALITGIQDTFKEGFKLPPIFGPETTPTPSAPVSSSPFPIAPRGI